MIPIKIICIIIIINLIKTAHGLGCSPPSPAKCSYCTGQGVCTGTGCVYIPSPGICIPPQTVSPSPYFPPSPASPPPTPPPTPPNPNPPHPNTSSLDVSLIIGGSGIVIGSLIGIISLLLAKRKSQNNKSTLNNSSNFSDSSNSNYDMSSMGVKKVKVDDLKSNNRHTIGSKSISYPTVDSKSDSRLNTDLRSDSIDSGATGYSVAHQVPLSDNMSVKSEDLDLYNSKVINKITNITKDDSAGDLNLFNPRVRSESGE